jgi:hypothetical protein
MACPYFYPLDRFDAKAWTKHPRLPLGDPYTGLCRVDPMRDWLPDQTTLREFCNQGYARARCPRFPEGPGFDAVRFSVTADQGSLLHIFYVREEDHQAREHGNLQYSADCHHFVQAPEDDLFRKQAGAYAESYLRRKQQPEEQARNPHRR